MDPQKKMRALFAEMDTCCCCCCCCSGYSFFCCCNSNYNCCCCCIIFNNCCIPQLQCFLGCCCLKLITGLILYSNRSQYPRTSSLPPRLRQPATSLIVYLGCRDSFYHNKRVQRYIYSVYQFKHFLNQALRQLSQARFVKTSLRRKDNSQESMHTCFDMLDDKKPFNG